MKQSIIAAMMSAIGICSGCKAQKTVKVLSPDDFIAAFKADTSAVLLDVRQPAEFDEGHIKGAVNLDWLNKEKFEKGLDKMDKARTYYIYCRSGRRSNAAAMKMRSEGFNVFDMKGGILEWKSLGFPVATDDGDPGKAIPAN